MSGPTPEYGACSKPNTKEKARSQGHVWGFLKRSFYNSIPVALETLRASTRFLQGLRLIWGCSESLFWQQLPGVQDVAPPGGRLREPQSGTTGAGALALGSRMVHGPIFVENPDGSITEASSV